MKTPHKRKDICSHLITIQSTVNSSRRCRIEAWTISNPTQNNAATVQKVLASALNDLKWWIWQLYLVLEHACSLPHTQCLMLVHIFIATCTTLCICEKRLMWYPAKTQRTGCKTESINLVTPYFRIPLLNILFKKHLLVIKTKNQ